MNNENFIIEESDLELARSICNEIKDDTIRSRAVGNALAADIVRKYFLDIEVDTTSGLHNISDVVSKIDISDIYLKDSYLDVRLYFEEKEIYVPKVHFDKHILPVAYMFVKIDEALSKALVTGFITPELIDITTDYNGYYKVDEEKLISYYDIESLLEEKDFNDDYENAEKMIYDYLDDNLDSDEEFYQMLLSSRYYRQMLKNASITKSKLLGLSFIREQKEESLLENESNSMLLENLTEDNENLILEEFTDIEDDLDNIEINENSIEQFELDEIGNDELIENNIENSLEEATTLEEFSNYETLNEEILEVTEDEINMFEDVEKTNQIENFESLEDENTDLEDILYDESNNYRNEPEEFSTNITPNIESYEDNNIESDDAEFAALEDFIDNDNTDEIQSEDIVEEGLYQEEENVEEHQQVETFEIREEDDNVLEEKEIEEYSQINKLFNQEVDNVGEISLNEEVTEKKSNSKVFPIVGLLVLIGLGGYFGYTKFYNQTASVKETLDPVKEFIKKDEIKKPKEAMPNETVENVKVEKASNEGTSVSIPAIEQNLAASIKVSNLSLNWEVPAGYISNPSAKRYFTKIGKIIQLNLKTELLLLSKPPITNKISLELEFNKANNKFAVKTVNISSGEKSVDDLIKNTVSSVLDMNLKTNMTIFSNIVGNPILVIHL